MARKKLDGVIVAVRYTPEGEISVVRVYERYGAVWSDHLLLNRKTLSERLNRGKHFAVGERKIYLGGLFRTGKTLRQLEGHIITEGQTGTRDLLAGVPVF